MSVINVQVSNSNIVECSQDMSDIIKRIMDTPNVIGVMVLNSDGFPIKTNLDNTTTVQYGSHKLTLTHIY